MDFALPAFLASKRSGCTTSSTDSTNQQRFGSPNFRPSSSFDFKEFITCCSTPTNSPCVQRAWYGSCSSSQPGMARNPSHQPQFVFASGRIGSLVRFRRLRDLLLPAVWFPAGMAGRSTPTAAWCCTGCQLQVHSHRGWVPIQPGSGHPSYLAYLRSGQHRSSQCCTIGFGRWVFCSPHCA